MRVTTNLPTKSEMTKRVFELTCGLVHALFEKVMNTYDDQEIVFHDGMNSFHLGMN